MEIRHLSPAPSLLHAATSAQFTRFLATGLLNTAFGYAVFLALLGLGLPAPAALALTNVAGVMFNFQTSRHLVFRSRHRGRLVRFVGVYVIVFLVNLVALAALRHGGLPGWAAQALLLLPMALLTFAGQRLFVFADQRQPR